MVVFISGGWLCLWESQTGLDAEVRGSSDARRMEQGTGGAGESQEKGAWVCRWDGGPLECPAASVLCSWSMCFTDPWNVILSRAGVMGETGGVLQGDCCSEHPRLPPAADLPQMCWAWGPMGQLHL